MAEQGRDSTLLLVGTFPRAYHSDPVDVAFGIDVLRRDRDGFTALGTARTTRPGWVAVHPDRRVVYAANEVREPDSGITVFTLDPSDGTLTEVARRATGGLPCHCTVDPSGRLLLVATIAGGAVEAFLLDSDGIPAGEAQVHRHVGSSVHRRQEQPHPHSVNPDPANEYVLVPDLGTDRVEVYELNTAEGASVPRPELGVAVAPGSGPRHLVFHPEGFVYLANEIAATITVFRYSRGRLRALQTVSTRDAGATGVRSAAGIALHPAARFLYCSNRSHGSSGEPPERGEDSIAWFEIGDDGLLTPRGRVATATIPRALTLAPDGEFLYAACQADGVIEEFAVGAGEPVRTGRVIRTPVPVCLAFVAPAVTC